jgi:Spy/CpxP family protein refolding chaperone
MRSLLAGHNWLWTLLIASLAFNVGFGTTFGVGTYRHYCSGSGGGGGGAECAARQDLLAQLDLTPEQQQSMTAAQDRMLEQVEELRQQLTVEREKLVDLLTAAGADRDTVAAQVDRIAAVQRQIQERVVSHLLQDKTLLTPDQQSKYNEIIRRRVCPLGGHGPESVPGACERHRECGRQGNGATDGRSEP